MEHRLGLAGLLIGIAGGGALAAEAEPAGHGRYAPWHGEAHVADATYRDNAPGPDLGFRGCAWFEHAAFGGRRGEARDGVRMSWVGTAWNDRISSVACQDGCRLIGSEDINHGGARRTFRGNAGALGPQWNDRISAVRVVCSGGP
jgi:hypothetical protein